MGRDLVQWVGEEGEQWKVSGNRLEEKATGFADRFYMSHDRKRELKDDSKAFCLGNWQVGGTSNHVRKDIGGASVRGSGTRNLI